MHDGRTGDRCQVMAKAHLAKMLRLFSLNIQLPVSLLHFLWDTY